MCCTDDGMRGGLDRIWEMELGELGESSQRNEGFDSLQIWGDASGGAGSAHSGGHESAVPTSAVCDGGTVEVKVDVHAA